MEQKQLDEIDDSYFGDEFIEEKEVKVEDFKDDGIKIEPVRTETAVEEKAKKKTTKKAKMSKDSRVEHTIKPEIKTEIVKEDRKEANKKKDELKFKVDAGVRDEVPKINPWKDEVDKKPASEASTWKAVAGIAVILLIFSVFTQGFNFSEKSFGLTGSAVGNQISVNEAEKTVFNYVNTKLLEPPYLAEVVEVVEAGNLYRVTLDIAGETVDSYLTKDGKLFFPQGFEVTGMVGLPDLAGAEDKEEPATTEEPVEAAASADNTENMPEAVETEVKEVSLTAKKWLFTPNLVTVNQGDKVKLIIEPQGLDFTFVIPELGVEEQVSGITTVEFTASELGEFKFSCSSCEEWRGMSGTLIVK